MPDQAQVSNPNPTKAVARLYLGRHGECWGWVVLLTPCCGAARVHGGNFRSEDPRESLGARACLCGSVYELVDGFPERTRILIEEARSKGMR